MSGDTYPRVVVDMGYEGDEWPWKTAAVGTHKVVPADAIVIERGALPPVAPDGDQYFEADGGSYISRTPAVHEQLALAHLSIAEYLRTHPPVDEAEVERLTKALAVAEMDHPDGPAPYVIARRLYLAGVRAPEVTK